MSKIQELGIKKNPTGNRKQREKSYSFLVFNSDIELTIVTMILWLLDSYLEEVTKVSKQGT